LAESKRQESQEKFRGGPMTNVVRWNCVLRGAAIAACVAACALGAVAQGTGAGTSGAGAKEEQPIPTSTFAIWSSAFEADQDIPAKHSCAGENVSPALTWKGAPDGTQAYALEVDDPDNPKKVIVHWVVYNIPSTTNSLAEGVPDKAKLADGSMQGKNEDGKTRWRGPCPPPGPAHHYFFKIYALDGPLQLKQKATAAQVEAAMKGHILGQAQLIGRYQTPR
jgi:Raf kinase inhibitor-like YbhB/YbcL family protein